MSGHTTDVAGSMGDTGIASARKRMTEVFARDNIRTRSLVNNLCAVAGLPLLEDLHVDNWALLFSAMHDETSLRSVLPTQVAEFRRYEDAASIRCREDDYDPEELTMEQQFAAFYDYIGNMGQHSASSRLQTPAQYETVSRLSWYAARHRQVTNVLLWLRTEAAPIVAALVALKHHPQSAFVSLKIPELQEHLAKVQEAYAEEMAQAQRNAAIQNTKSSRA